MSKRRKKQAVSPYLKNQFRLFARSLVQDGNHKQIHIYERWLAERLACGKFGPEDQDQVFQFLTAFHRLRPDLKGPSRDLFRYLDLPLLYQAVRMALPDLVMAPSEVPGEMLWLYRNEWTGVFVGIPRSKQAALRYGYQTQWCVSALKSNNWFWPYNLRGPLVYFLTPLGKYCWATANHDFRNARDLPLKEEEASLLARRFPIIPHMMSDIAAVLQREKRLFRAPGIPEPLILPQLRKIMEVARPIPSSWGEVVPAPVKGRPDDDLWEKQYEAYLEKLRGSYAYCLAEAKKRPSVLFDVPEGFKTNAFYFRVLMHPYSNLLSSVPFSVFAEEDGKPKVFLQRFLKINLRYIAGASNLDVRRMRESSLFSALWQLLELFKKNERVLDLDPFMRKEGCFINENGFFDMVGAVDFGSSRKKPCCRGKARRCVRPFQA